MIDTDKYESAVYKVIVFLEDNEQYGDDWSKERRELNDLLAEVKRLRKINDLHMSIKREETKENLKVYKENDRLTKLCIERYAEVKRLRGTVKMIMEYMRTEGDSDDYYTLKEMVE